MIYYLQVKPVPEVYQFVCERDCKMRAKRIQPAPDFLLSEVLFSIVFPVYICCMHGPGAGQWCWTAGQPSSVVAPLWLHRCMKFAVADAEILFYI